MNARNSLKTKFLIALTAMVFLPLYSCDPEASSVSGYTSDTPPAPKPGEEITIFSINDLHGKIDGSNEHSSILDLAGSIENDPRYDPYSSVIVSAGDSWQGSYASGYDYGKTTTELFNLLGVKAMTLGNHEFDWGEEQLITNGKIADFPFLASNLISGDTGKSPYWVDSYTIVETGGFSIGFVGVIGPYLESSIADGLLKDDYFSEDIALVEEAYLSCIEDGADAVFLLAHEDGYSDYLDKVTERIPFKGVFAGHSHQRQNLTASSGTRILQGGANNEAYSYMTIDTETWSVTSYGIGDVTSKPTTNDALEEALENYLNTLPDQVFAQIEGTWNTTTTAKFILSAMLYAIYTTAPEYYTPNLVAIHNTGGVRDSYGMHRTPVDFTMSLIQQASPFDNTLYLLPERSEDIDEIIEHYYSRYVYLEDPYLDIVTISYLVNDNYSEMFTPEGAIPLVDHVRGGDYIIYNAIADYASYIDSLGKVINPDDFIQWPTVESVLFM